jgi:hypothetical protein
MTAQHWWAALHAAHEKPSIGQAATQHRNKSGKAELEGWLLS